jgi:hypothetical protein
MYATVHPKKPLPFAADSFCPGSTARLGSRHPDKKFYVIWREYPGSGFFSNVFHVLCHLERAHSLGMEPVVDFRDFVTLYHEEEEIAGTRNVWEYYFKPTSRVPLDEVYDSSHVFLCDGKYPRGFGHDAAHHARLRLCFDRSVRIHPEIEQSVKQWMGGFGARTLGVHFRGQEQNRAPGHLFGPTGRQILRVTNKALEEGDFDRIFVVTEDQRYLDLLRAEFGSMVFATDSFRTSGENAYRMSPRPLHKYLLGREVLVDALLLSRCQALVASGSNVSEFATLVNGGRFEAVWRIWNGANSTNPLAALYLYRLRRSLPSRLGGLPGTVWKSASAITKRERSSEEYLDGGVRACG